MRRYCARPPFALDRLRELDREHLIDDPRKRAPAAVARRPARGPILTIARQRLC